MRLFIAICVNKEIKAGIRKVCTELKSAGVSGNWTADENLHLTLAFLGEVDDWKRVREAMSGLSFSSFPLSLEKTGTFGDLGWVGLKGSEELTRLSKDIRLALDRADIGYDRKPFKPHITIVRQAKRLGQTAPVVPSVSMKVSRVSLMKSERVQGKMRYTEIFAVSAED